MDQTKFICSACKAETIGEPGSEELKTKLCADCYRHIYAVNNDANTQHPKRRREINWKKLIPNPITRQRCKNAENYRKNRKYILAKANERYAVKKLAGTTPDTSLNNAKFYRKNREAILANNKERLALKHLLGIKPYLIREDPQNRKH